MIKSLSYANAWTGWILTNLAGVNYNWFSKKVLVLFPSRSCVRHSCPCLCHRQDQLNTRQGRLKRMIHETEVLNCTHCKCKTHSRQIGSWTQISAAHGMVTCFCTYQRARVQVSPPSGPCALHLSSPSAGGKLSCAVPSERLPLNARSWKNKPLETSLRALQPEILVTKRNG